MKNFWVQVIALIFVIFAGTILTFNPQFLDFIPTRNQNSQIQTNPQNNASLTQIKIIDGVQANPTIVKVVLNVEVADTKEKRAKGLGGRQSLATNSGMLFLFEQPDKYTFWMKGLSFPLDFIWINGDLVVDLLANVLPPQPGQTDDALPRYAPTVVVNKVLEVNAGFIAEYKVAVGDRIEQAQ